MLLKSWRALAALLFGAAVCAPAAAQTRPQPQPRYDAFTIAPVPVDVTAANANAARDQALAEGQKRAFQMLIQRLTLPSGRNRVPQPNTAQLNDLVQDFEVTRERRSGVRYIAEYNFRFRPDLVRQLLTGAGVAFADTPSKPLVVLAVLQEGGRPALWDDPNPWRDAWARAKLPTGLVPVVIPLGEIDDVSAIDGDAAVRGDDAALRAISQRYDGDDVLVAQATPKAGATHGFDIAATRYAPGNPAGRQSWTSSVTGNPGESDGDMMTRGIADIMGRVEEAWKVANILDPRQGGTLVVRVPTAGLGDWVAVRDRLTGIAAVRGSRLIALDRDGARVELHYLGDPAQLRFALAQRNLELSGSDPDWILQQRAGAPR